MPNRPAISLMSMIELAEARSSEVFRYRICLQTSTRSKHDALPSTEDDLQSVARDHTRFRSHSNLCNKAPERLLYQESRYLRIT